MVIFIGDDEVEIQRPRFKNWLRLEALYSQLKREMESKKIDGICSTIYLMLSIVSNKDETYWAGLGWKDVAQAMDGMEKICVVTYDFPFMRERAKGEKPAWDYKGRDWFAWLHMFAKGYGWYEEKVAELDVDTALALVQELMVDEQLSKEWSYRLSELAYAYDSSTKKAKYVPLDRPDWMKEVPVIKELKKVTIPVKMLPLGNVVNFWDVYADAGKSPSPSPND